MAVKYYTLAAGQGDRYAQNNLGGMYYRDGEGVRKNKAMAKKWFVLAADNGEREAKKELRKLE